MISSTNMLLLKAIRNPAVSRLWMGQVTSGIGDEIYRVAFIWMAVQLVGEETGYLAALQFAASLLMNLFGTKWLAHLRSEQTLVRLDLYRAGIVLIPVVLHLFGAPSFTALVLCSISIAALGALFEPALMETIPKVAHDPLLLRATNGLMSTTFRLARVLGPAIVGLLSGFVPMVHFFTIDAATYLFSAYCVKTIRFQESPQRSNDAGIIQNWNETWALLKSRPAVYRTLMAKSLTGGAWWLCYSIGLALFAHEIDPTNVTTFGMIMSAYGVGNIAGSLIFGNLHRNHPEKMVYTGLIWFGLMFLSIPLTTSLPVILLFTALSAVGGPWNDIAFVDLVQANYTGTSLTKIFRLRLMIETFCTLVLMAASPIIFKFVSVRLVIFVGGLSFVLQALYYSWKSRQDSRPVRTQ